MAKSAFNEVIDHIKNVKRRFGAEIVKKIMFNDDETLNDEALDELDEQADSASVRNKELSEFSVFLSLSKLSEQKLESIQSPAMEDFDESSNSSTEKRKKRPLRNRDEKTDRSASGRKSSEQRFVGPLGVELRERCDIATQTEKEKNAPRKSECGSTEREDIYKKAHQEAKLSFQKELEAEQRKHAQVR